jgi:4-azaleucine resistance transporter AzlC
VTFDRASVLQGFRDGLPIAIAAIPFGLIIGLSGVQAGLTALQSSAMPYVVYAGASQLASLQLLGGGAPLVVIWLTAALINVRFLIYSASLAGHFAHLSVPWRLLLAYVTTDQVFGLTVTRFRTAHKPKNPGAYFLVLAGLCWLAWTGAGVVGATMGTALPTAWQLDFIVPLIFLALLVSSLRNGPAWAAAVVGGGVAVLAQGLPYNAGLIVGTLAGITSGTLLERARNGN